MKLPRWMFDEVKRILGAANLRTAPGTVAVAVSFTVHVPEGSLNRPDVVLQSIRETAIELLDLKEAEVRELLAAESKSEFKANQLLRLQNGEKRSV